MERGRGRGRGGGGGGGERKSGEQWEIMNEDVHVHVCIRT